MVRYLLDLQLQLKNSIEYIKCQIILITSRCCHIFCFLPFLIKTVYMYKQFSEITPV